MKKLLVMMLVVAMSVAMLTGCNTNANGEETSKNSEEGTVSSSEEGVSDGEVSENEVLEEMTLEEKIAAEMPAKLEVGENEIIVPETVTAEQIIGRWEEIKVTEGEYVEDINRENLAGLLVLNCSYMEPDEFNALVNEHFGSKDELMTSYIGYVSYLFDVERIYGNGSSIVPEKLFFDKYLINQAEQLHYLLEMYQTDTENSKEYYDIMKNFLFYDENEFLTFDCDDTRLEGSGLASLQDIIINSMTYDIMEYDQDLYLDGVIAESRENVRDIVYEHANQ